MWAPQPGPQLAAIMGCEISELFFGGARGGGKTDFLLGDYAQDLGNFGPAWKGVLFRQTYKELDNIRQRAWALYPKLGGSFNKGEQTWFFPGGETLRFRTIERLEDCNDYQGHEYSWIGWDELPNLKDFNIYRRLRACLRSAESIPTKRIRSTGNPGGRIHGEVKRYFGIDRHPNGYHVIDGDRVFIPSKVQDNKLMLRNDPNYIKQLQGSGPPELVKAWLDGDWDAVLGAFFREWDPAVHVIKPFYIPHHWMRIRAFDWGFSRPFCVLWCAVASEYHKGIPKGAIVVFREWYGAGRPNEGLRLNDAEIAKGILQRDYGLPCQISVADPAIWDFSRGTSQAETMMHHGVYFDKADNKRIPGWQQVRWRLAGEDGKPMLYVFDNCAELIRTLPVMQHDTRNSEDLDSTAEDHAVDTLRYALMTRTYNPPHIGNVVDYARSLQ